LPPCTLDARDAALIIPKGNLLDYTREMAFNSELPGMRTRITDFDIVAADGKVALL
jgi:hypothetical protein